jgi:hypothetical protein
MKLPDSWRGWTVSVVALILLVLIVGSSQPFQTRIEETTKYYSSEALQKGTPYIFVVIKTFKSCLGVYIIEKNAVVTALATLAIAYFTWTIWRINQEGLAHSHKVERAYISGGGVRAREFFDLAANGTTPRTRETGEFEFHINNYGKTPGILYKIGFGFCDERAIPAVPAYTFRYRHNPIDPGRRGEPIYRHKIPTEHKTPVVYGRFYYKTIFATCHSSGFIYRILPNVAPESISPPSYDYIQEQDEDCENASLAANPPEEPKVTT